MQDNKFSPEANELAEEALEQIAGGVESQHVTISASDGLGDFMIMGDTCGGTIIGNTLDLARGK